MRRRNLNTSNVSIYQTVNEAPADCQTNLNTSNVSIYQDKSKIVIECHVFKYIQCFYLSITGVIMDLFIEI